MGDHMNSLLHKPMERDAKVIARNANKRMRTAAARGYRAWGTADAPKFIAKQRAKAKAEKARRDAFNKREKRRLEKAAKAAQVVSELTS